MEKSNFKIGWAYCTYIDSLRNGEFYYINQCDKEFEANIFYSKKNLCETKAPLFIQYIGNGIFKDILAGKTISVLKDGNYELLEDKKSVNKTENYGNYNDITPTLNHIYSHPMVISVEDICTIGKKQIDEYSSYNPNTIKKMLEESEDKARILFLKSLEQYIDFDYMFVKEDEQGAKQLIK